MKIQFSSKNMTVPDRVYSHAEQRINELEPLFRGAPEATVVFSAENGKHVIELTIFSLMPPLPPSAGSCGSTTTS